MFLSLLLASAMAVQLTSAASTEMLGINVPDEFRVGNHQRNGETEIIEFIEPPETVDNWSKLITGFTFCGGAQAGLDAFYTRWMDGLRGACPALKDTSVRGNVDGHPAIRGTLSCPKNPQTGKPENLSAFVVQGGADLQMAQVAFRHAIGPADTALIQRIAGSLKVCDQNNVALCSGRKATGFHLAH